MTADVLKKLYNNSKLASLSLNNDYPSADAFANLEAAKEAPLNMKPSARFANISRNAYDEFGQTGFKTMAAIKALKPTNAFSILFGSGDAFTEDIKQDMEAARKRYASTPAGILPAFLTAPINKDARAYYLQKRLYNRVKNFNEDYKIPINMTKAALAALLIGAGIKMAKRRKDEQVQSQLPPEYYYYE